MKVVLLGTKDLGVDICERVARHLKSLGKIKDYIVTDKTVELIFNGEEVVVEFKDFAEVLGDLSAEDLKAFWRSVWEKVHDGSVELYDDEKAVLRSL
jgi:hypothetical protein